MTVKELKDRLSKLPAAADHASVVYETMEPDPEGGGGYVFESVEEVRFQDESPELCVLSQWEDQTDPTTSRETLAALPPAGRIR